MSFPTLQATVLQKNTANAYICGPCGDYGRVMPIPCGTAAIVGAQYWATPQKTPYFQGFKYTIAATAPTEDSIAVFKLTNSITSDYYMVIGTIEDYSAACGSCCDTSPVPTLVVSDLVDITSCQDTCTVDGTNFDAFWAVEAPIDGADEYYARVEADGALVWQQVAGSANIAALIIALNANATDGATIVWSNPDEQSIRARTTAVKNICFIACVRPA